ncbi:MAG TPA: hypothetical protein VLA19_15855 [Herpetosiphonaceae bacterium]|nr:hypothetical protein [Herpetosiphonaceae bacterium]
MPEAQQTTARNIHGQLGRLPNIFVRVGRGTFGLAEWGLVQERSSADTACRLLEEEGAPLDLETLTDRVLDVWQIQRRSVRAAIDLDPRFEEVRTGVYWLAGKPLPDGTGVERQTDAAEAADVQRRRSTTPTIAADTLLEHLRTLLADDRPRTVEEIAKGLEEAGLGPIPIALISRVLIQKGRSTFTYDRTTSMVSFAAASVRPTPPTYDRYDAWSLALTSFFVEGIPRGALIFLGTDDQNLHEVARLLPDPPEQAADDFCAAVRNRVVTGGSVNLSSIQGHYPDGKPHGVAFLAAMVLAAARMEENETAGPSNYFVRLRQVLGLPAQEGRPLGMRSGADAEEPFWRTWNQWLQEQGFLPSARGGEGAEKYIRYPISQALLRNADKERLRRLFEARHWGQDLGPEALIAQLHRETYHLSQHLRELLAAEGQRLQAVADAIAEYYDLWRESQHGDVPRGRGGWIGFPLAGLYRTEDIISGDVRYFLYPRQPRRHRPEQVRVKVAGASYSLVDERQGWYAPVAEILFTDLDQGGLYPITEPPYLGDLRLPVRPLWMLVPDPDNPDSGVYASWGNPPLGTPFLLLCRSELVPRLVQLRAEQLIQWAGEPRAVVGTDHWVEIHHCMVVSEAASTESQENQELYEALRPRETVNVSLSGGLRAPNLGAWIEGYGPAITVFTFQRVSDVTIFRVADEEEVFGQPITPNEPCQIPWPGTGDYRIEACAGGQRTERLVKIVPWEHLRRTLVTQPERVRIGAWQVTGAIIEIV